MKSRQHICDARHAYRGEERVASVAISPVVRRGNYIQLYSIAFIGNFVRLGSRMGEEEHCSGVAKYHQRAISTGRGLLPNTQQWSGRLAHNLRLFRCEVTSWRWRWRWLRIAREKKRDRERVMDAVRRRRLVEKCAQARESRSCYPRRHHRTPSLHSFPALVRVPRSRISCPAARGGGGGGVASSHPSPRASPRRSRSVHPHPLSSSQKRTLVSVALVLRLDPRPIPTRNGQHFRDQGVREVSQ